MKLKLKTIENLILLLIIGQVVVFRYFNVYEIVNKIILTLIILLLFLNLIIEKKLEFKVRGNLTSIIILIVLLIVNGLIYGINQTFKSNVLMIFYPLMNMSFFVWYVMRYQDYFYGRMVQLRYVVNIYFIINIVVMLIQLQGNYFMVGVVTQENTLYHDLVSGLFGYSMTASVCYFSTFVIIYNIVIAKAMKVRIKKILFNIYNFFLVLIMAYLSTQNDNVQYFAIVMLALIFILLSNNRLNTITGMQKVIFVVLLSVFGIIILLFTVPGLFEILNERVLYKFIGAIEHMYDGASVTHGSMERIALVVYGLTNADGWVLGRGLSYAGVYTPYTFGFVHFGNANIGAFICLGGIWFYFSIIYLYSTRLIAMVEYNICKKKKIFYRLVIPIFLIVVSLFSLPFTDVSIGLCVFFIILTFGLNEYLDSNIKEIKSAK
mgnify:CR=1 FL=1